MATTAQVNRLAAGAHAGTTGVEAYDQAQANVRQGRDQAIANLQKMATDIGAPGAFTTQLATQISAPAATALANLAQEGASAAAVQQQNQSGTANYMSEANAALPLIRAEADRDLGQQINMLSASHAGDAIDAAGRLAAARVAAAAEQARARAASAAPELSDSALRNQLMGMAQAIREQSYAKEVPAIQKGGQSAKHDTGVLGRRAAIWEHLREANPNDPSFGKQLEAYQTQEQTRAKDLAAYTAAFAKLRAQTYGPGITGEAQRLGAQAGIPTARLYGLLGPREEASYLSATKRAGQYVEPGQQDLTGQTADAYTAGSQLGFDRKKIDELSTKKIYAWTDYSSPAAKEFNRWLKGGGYDKSEWSDDEIANMSDQDRWKARNAFIAQDKTGDFAETVASHVFADAKRSVDMGIDYQTWVNDITRTEEYGRDRDAFNLAMAQVAPLFAYAAALHTRQTKPTSPLDFAGSDMGYGYGDESNPYGG